MTLGERVREVRKANKLNLDDFGAKLDVTGPAISMMERGKSSITERTLKAICQKFGVNEAWLRTGEGEMHAPDAPDELEEIRKSLAHVVFRVEGLLKLSDVFLDNFQLRFGVGCNFTQRTRYLRKLQVPLIQE